MTKKRYNEILAEFGVSRLTSFNHKQLLELTEEQLRKLLTSFIKFIEGEKK